MARETVQMPKRWPNTGIFCREIFYLDYTSGVIWSIIRKGSTFFI